MPLTLAVAQANLDIWIAADAAVADGQSYSIGGDINRTVTRVDAGLITEKIEFWQKQVEKLSRGGMRIRGVIPYDR